MVKVDSGEFPLMRNIDLSRQPERMKVYTAWTKAFNYQVPDAVNHLADVIEDVFKYELWKDNYLDSPEQFFERIGIFGLNLDEPAKLIAELRSKKPTKRDEIASRIEQAKALAAQGKTQREIAEELGVSQKTVSNALVKKSVYTQKITKEKRKVKQYKISQYTQPETAAAKIIATFGPAFATDLVRAIRELTEKGGESANNS